MIDKELINSWVEHNAPESIKDILLVGVVLVEAKEFEDKRFSKRQFDRRCQYPNMGNIFTDAESDRILELRGIIDNWRVTEEEKKAVSDEFGRPFESMRSRLKLMVRNGYDCK